MSPRLGTSRHLQNISQLFTSDFNGRGHIPFLQETQILQLIDYLAHPDQHYAMITGVTTIREPQYNITLNCLVFAHNIKTRLEMIQCNLHNYIIIIIIYLLPSKRRVQW